jgi:hypothetical protein
MECVGMPRLHNTNSNSESQSVSGTSTVIEPLSLVLADDRKIEDPEDLVQLSESGTRVCRL